MLPSFSRGLLVATACLNTALVSNAQDLPQSPHGFTCGYRSPTEWQAQFRAAVASGAIDDPALRPLPALPGVVRNESVDSCLTNAQIFPWEDSSQLFTAPYSIDQMLNLLSLATTDLVATHGDVFDFVGFFLNFSPAQQLGSAFYFPLFNDVAGIGDPRGMGTPLFDQKPMYGVPGQQLQGWVMMWDINFFWEPGAGTPAANLTRLVLGHELEHRYAAFLPPLADGRVMQGDNMGCGTQVHWNRRVDAQGGCLELAEWVGSNPADGFFGFQFNQDIVGGLYSYLDLYLMGFVSAAELDASISELRYVEGPSCTSPSNGPISTFDSSDIVAVAGPRTPDVSTSQKDFRMAWIMIHLPGDEPDVVELDRAVGILEQSEIDFHTSTLERGSIDHSLFDDCDCNGVDDAIDIAGGALDLDGNGVLDACESSSYCTGKVNSDGCTPQIAFRGTPSLSAAGPFDIAGEDLVAGKNGLLFYGLAGPAASPFNGGLLCVQPPLRRTVIQNSAGAGSCGGSFSFDFNAWLAGGNEPFATVGGQVNGQYWYRDPAASFGIGLTNAIEFVVGP